ncbi:DUF4407 domain-containing protein [Actinocorallia sp. A-T 12471]|uniref:DUF4407 domain-containing protein n=1 Tax=Actinocorallia sp. A-T 12471 TaxID=3089813 RepID=UPI0029D377B9|nr:DUF4407 domain-containing protein [Actinocorallia sp. A-T 12471]MDX6739055.1 DUF4407 domain-containing protein [Actinocorallia sp. A-T 12471]
MRDFLIILSGANRKVLAQCPSERPKFQGIGGAVLTTAVLAVFSMWFALSSAVGVSAPVALPVALVWGVMILGIDRWLVSTLPTEGARRFRTAAPRVAMALLMGFVISTPLVLRIFESEINAQMVVIKQRDMNAFVERQKSGANGKDVATLREEVERLQDVIAKNGDVPADPATDARVVALTAELKDARKDMQTHYDKWQCQLYGGAGCTKKGQGPLADASRNAYEKARKRVTSITGQIEDRKDELAANDEQTRENRVGEATEALPAAKEQLDAAVQRQTDLQTQFDLENKAANGLLIRLKALNEITGSNATLVGARVLLFLLFLLFECLPVLVKLMLRAENYERILDIEKRDELRRARGNYSRLRLGGSGGSGAGGEWTLGDTWKRDPRPADGTAQPPADAADPGAARRGERVTPQRTTTLPLPPDEAPGGSDAHTSVDHVKIRDMRDLDRSPFDVPGDGLGDDDDLFGDEKF